MDSDTQPQHYELSENAKKKIQDLRGLCEPYWQRLPKHPFVKAIIEGRLSVDQFKNYYTQWGKVIGELILSLYSNTLSRFSAVLLRYPELQRSVVEHMVEELSHQDVEGIYMTTARALGIKYDEVSQSRVIPEMQAYLNWVVRLSYQGTFAEIRASSFANEGCLSSVSSALAPAIIRRYGLSEREAAYYVEHGPADKKHVEVNAFVLGRLIDLGLVEERPGYGIFYCAETVCKTNFIMLDGAYRSFLLQESYAESPP
jgi:pyrroloquinoline quinone (PQQ) biosynthesis protein C